MCDSSGWGAVIAGGWSRLCGLKRRTADWSNADSRCWCTRVPRGKTVGKFSNGKGFTSGCRCWQSVEGAHSFYVIILAARGKSKAVSGMLLSVFISSCCLVSDSLVKPSCSYIILQTCCVFAEMLTEKWKEFHNKWSVGSFNGSANAPAWADMPNEDFRDQAKL